MGRERRKERMSTSSKKDRAPVVLRVLRHSPFFHLIIRFCCRPRHTKLDMRSLGWCSAKTPKHAGNTKKKTKLQKAPIAPIEP